MRPSAVLISISNLLFFSEKRKSRKFYDAFKGLWLFDQLLKGDFDSKPGNMTLNAGDHKNKGNGIWVSKNGDEANFAWSISDSGSIFTLSPEVSSAIPNQASSSLADYKGSYTIQSLDDTYLILQKAKVIIKFKRYINK